MISSINDINSYNTIDNKDCIVGEYYYIPEGKLILKFIKSENNKFHFIIVAKPGDLFCNTPLVLGPGLNKLVPIKKIDFTVQV